MSSRRIVTLLLFTVAAACTPKDQPGHADAGASTHASASASAASTNAAASSSAASAAPSAAPATAANDPLPSHSDVAKKVRGEITKQNYKTELDKLEKEIQ